ncbi:hypothetical protein [Halanaerobium sp. MA284_MarDTE_T2]|uniref:hypothetical protein n=1 Tax=Halanaerobium sp. MA284_MarDTE_T2 TaxID=2183913 RepID=UPI000DF48405|nr:hypothetical protein [Halanaerobium sp. MA284_MarDTE_T2]RCW49886.1 hypothetical protein DFR78_10458 [Halanaerobium sp. MA284_MarDTE_T2]
MRKFFIEKVEGDYSDVLLARGVAELVKEVFNQNNFEGVDIWINNNGAFFVIESEKEIKKEYFNQLNFNTLYPLIYYDKMDDKPNYTENIIDFTQEKKYKDWSPNERKSSLIRQATGIPLSNKIMNDIYKINDYFSELVYLILEHYSNPTEKFNDLVAKIDDLFINIQLNNFKSIVKNNLKDNELSRIESDLDELFNEFENFHWSKRNKVKDLIKDKLNESANNLEETKTIKKLYNEAKIDFITTHNALSSLLPKRVKGLNNDDISASSSISPKNTSENWLRLYLVLIGFYKSLILQGMQSGNRLYSVISPNQVSISRFDNIYGSVVNGFHPGNTLEKQNILFLSDFIINLLDKLEDFNQSKRRKRRRTVLKNYIEGIKNVYLVDMGQNHIIKNIYDLNVPNWIILDEEKDKVGFKKVFQEFKELITPIDDKNEDVKLFQELYNFLTTEEVGSLLSYYYQHALLAMQRLGNNESAKMYTKRSVKFIMNKLDNAGGGGYSKILENEGFQNFAKAIRNSTLIPIYLGKKKKIKFGLLQDIRRASLNKDTLITKLSTFMADYNNENGLDNFHNQNPMRSNLTTQDFEDIVALIDDHDSKIIGNMLLAYGFGKDEKVEKVKGDEDNNE